MDLLSMLNDGPAPEKRPSQASQPDVHRPTSQVVPLTPGANGRPMYGSQPSTQPTPPYGPPSAAAPVSRQSTGLTPLQTPSQGPGGVQYPFPSQQQQQPLQSPASAHPPGQQYQPYGPYSATTPGARPPSHTFQYPQPSPTQYQQHAIPPGVHAHHTSSLSPTPPSHHSQTPHSVRQSPLDVLSQGQHQPPPQQQYYQHSQPSTPLGPPPLHYQRTPYNGPQDIHSPYHQRTLSGTSNGIISGSPAHHHPSIGNLVDSPSAYNRHSPQLRRTSDYLSQQERERSLSVSPKTKVFPRAPSLGSRHSSQQDMYPTSARSSLQHQHSAGVAALVETPGHVHQPIQFSHQTVAQPPPIHSQPSQVAKDPTLSAQTPHSAAPYIIPDVSLSAHPNNQQPHVQPPAIQHQPQRMDMNHLLTPAHSVVSMDGAGDGTLPQAKQRKQQENSIFMKPSPKPKKPAVAPAPPPSERRSTPEHRPGAAETVAVTRADQHQQLHNDAPAHAVVKEPSAPKATRAPESKKRPAESALPAEGPPAKRGRTQKFTERPIWARLARTNPNFNAQLNGAPQGRPQQPPKANGVLAVTPAPAQQQHQMPPQPNGHLPRAGGSNTEAQPWMQNPPLDNDLIDARQLFGQWEKSIRWQQPHVDIEKAVMDWLYMQLKDLHDVDDPAECVIEIEAKIGRIIGKDDGVRVQLPVLSATVLEERWAKQKTRFESQMEEPEHKSMNEFLNLAIKDTLQKGRVAMQYDHPRETDSFQPLSAVGIQALPQAFRNRKLAPGREMRLRTSTDYKTKNVTARIVKYHVADLHIFNPRHDYDCRISINLEANMNRPELAPFHELVEPPGTSNNFDSPERRKDRLSYKHLAYSIDLTRVDVKGSPAKYELELEVDAQVLREQIRAMDEGRGSFGFQTVVSGFLDNATYLMRQKPVAAGQGQQ
ncbi:hypothetical protein LTR36_002904 [Oleoguttula mirabilis]|uniref:mRNA-capping enzyme subunit beta n=1 Tax=Oleoguttula mirabilis TaxID=1507867 RepID=A0AAV9JJH3_9PEZI|nr:hypothetical protein LTR36_002904 [Oleoguttula mirabilis]